MDLWKSFPTLIFMAIIAIFIYNSVYLYEISVLSYDLVILRFLLIVLVTLLFFMAQRNLLRYVYHQRTRI